MRAAPHAARGAARVAIVAGLLAAPALVAAQIAATPKPLIEEQRQQERERALREQQERTVDERVKPVAIDTQTLPAHEVPCFDIHRLELSGELAEDLQWALDSAARSAIRFAKRQKSHLARAPRA